MDAKNDPNLVVKDAEQRHSGAVLSKGVKVDESILVHGTPEDLFRFWRNFENLPRFMNNLKIVTVKDTKQSHWIAKTIGNIDVEWDAEIIAEIPNQMISWKTLDGSDVAHAGSVWFHPSPTGRGTEVRVQLIYDPPGGKLAELITWLFGEDPKQQIREDLVRFRDLMEGPDSPVVNRPLTSH
jgi:uncharacterized membrane protein